MQLVRIPETKVGDRLVAQTALQPGIMTVRKGITEKAGMKNGQE